MTQGMISAPQPEAVEAGLDIFKAGGNVMDAAIAAAMVQTVKHRGGKPYTALQPQHYYTM